jgi:hypothetical protein
MKGALFSMAGSSFYADVTAIRERARREMRHSRDALFASGINRALVSSAFTRPADGVVDLLGT